MFLIINPTTGTNANRHILCRNFRDLMGCNWSKASNGNTYIVTILNPNKSGTYDLALTVVTEPVSGKTYVKGSIYQNPTNRYSPIPMRGLLGIMDMGLDMDMDMDELKKFDISTLLTGFAVNGHIPITNVPESVLDNYDELTKILDAFFSEEAPGVSAMDS